MPEMPEEINFIDEEQRVDFIYQELWSRGLFVERSVIEEILEVDLEFLLENGYAYYEDVEEFE